MSGANAGFVLATPVGLVVAGFWAAASAVEYGLDASLRIVRHSRALTGLVLGVIAAWAVVSLAELKPLSDSVRPEDVTLPLAILALFGVPAYAYAAVDYFRVWLAPAPAGCRSRGVRVRPAGRGADRGRGLAGHELAAELVGVARADGVSFAAIAAAAYSEWYEERFSALYLDETLAGHRDVSVLFADLAGFTPFSEARGPEAVHAMMVAYFGELAPMISDTFKGEVQDFVGDQIFAIFNKRGDQPDHALVGRARRWSCSAARR